MNANSAPQDARHATQDEFLGGLRDAKRPVAIFLLNGIKLRGLVHSFNKFAIMLEGATVQVI